MNTRFLVAVIFRSGQYIIPSGSDIVYDGDRLYLIATEGDFKHVFASMGIRMTKINKIAIDVIGKRQADDWVIRPSGPCWHYRAETRSGGSCCETSNPRASAG